MTGILPVDKPEGPTSHDIVDRLRRTLGMRRIGHTGTLDPFASGLLLMCVGPATRLAEYMEPLTKTYTATAELGIATDTDDLTGTVLATSEAWKGLDEAAIRAAFADQSGDQAQVPPAFSAKKVEGERLYRRARRGEDVSPRPVPVSIRRLDVVEVAPPRVRFEVECSAGTYIRAIARDAGVRLGVGAHLVGLRRTGIGGYCVEDAAPPASLDDAEALRGFLRSPLAALAHMPHLDVGDDDARRIQNGSAVPRPDALHADGPVAVAHQGLLIAIAEITASGVQPRKVFTHD